MVKVRAINTIRFVQEAEMTPEELEAAIANKSNAEQSLLALYKHEIEIKDLIEESASIEVEVIDE